jgi:hypothetical protein
LKETYVGTSACHALMTRCIRAVSKAIDRSLGQSQSGRRSYLLSSSATFRKLGKLVILLNRGMSGINHDLINDS